MQNYLGMGTVTFDMVGLKGRLDNELYDHEEFEKAFKFMKKKFKYDYKYGSHGLKRPWKNDELLATSIKMTMIIRDLMVGNPNLADKKLGKKYGYKADVEHAQGFNAIAAGTQGQRQWTDLYPNFDMAESILNSTFDWNGFRAPKVIATENDSKNAIGMLFASLLSGMPQLFSDIRTNWTPESIKKATGVDVSKIAGNGLIDKRNSGSGSLNYAIDVIKLIKGGKKMSIQEIAEAIRSDKKIQKELTDKAIKGTTYTGADLIYFPGDGLSSNYRTPGNIPMTAYRYNVVGGQLTCSVVEGKTVQLPKKVADHISKCTNESWPETYWVPRGMTSYEYMSKIGPNQDGNSFVLIGADFITLNAMLRIPVDMHNIPEKDIFRPTMWDRFGGDDFRVCEELGPLYA
jgi:L-fucose isomerase